MRIAFIGVGTMGGPMASRLLGAGHQITVFNRTAGRARPLVEAGAVLAPTAAAATLAAEVVCTCVTNGQALRDVALGPDGILAGAASDGASRLWIDFSTVGPQVIRELAALAAGSRVRTVDAPVTGGDVGAREGTLTILVGGDAPDVEAAMPALRPVGRRIEHMGPLGAGQVTKLVQNLIGGVNLVAAAEGLTLGRRLGLEPVALARLLMASTADSFQLRSLADRIESGDRAPGFSAVNRTKDFRLALDIAREANVAVFTSAAAAEMMTWTVREGFGERDQTAVWDALNAD